MKQLLYWLHGALAERQLLRPAFRFRLPLAAVRWLLDRVQMHELRHGPTQGCPDCRHYGRICDGCREERKKVWG